LKLRQPLPAYVFMFGWGLHLEEHPMDGVLFWLTFISGGLGLVLTAVTTLGPQTKQADGRLNRVGRLLLAVAIISWFVTTVNTELQSREADRERIAADSASRARFDSTTRRLERILNASAALRGETERLRDLQRKGLLEVDSLSAVSQALSTQQQHAISELGVNLELSRLISDSLQASVVLTRQIGDSLYLVEARARERSGELLALVHRTQNPLTYLRAAVTLYLPGNSQPTEALLQQLYATSGPEPGSSFLERGITATVDGRPVHFGFPKRLSISFRPSAEECGHESQVNEPVLAQRDLTYDSAKVELFTDVTGRVTGGMQIEWPEGDFDLAAAADLSVEDLRDACVYISFSGYAGWEGAHFWRDFAISLPRIALPHGRRGRVLPDPQYGPGMPVWSGRLELLQ
jgi:uncharacterized protein (DUF779 family)